MRLRKQRVKALGGQGAPLVPMETNSFLDSTIFFASTWRNKAIYPLSIMEKTAYDIRTGNMVLNHNHSKNKNSITK